MGAEDLWPEFRSMNDLSPCGVCRLHAELDRGGDELLIGRFGPFLLRHHPLPAPMPGWLLLDSRRHVGGPADFDDEECVALGPMLRRSSALVRTLAGCERVYAIAFGEGARHFHLHLIPRAAAEPASESWRIADLYRAVASGERAPADPLLVADLVRRARPLASAWPSAALP
jgi:diadenosine tetraphosphate (Ap4A) HIT family hydrolase